MISKELLSEVLKADIRKINNSILDGNLYYYKTFVKCKSKINIYELAHKCKEWAYNNGYYLTIYNDAIDIILKTNCKIIENIADGSFKYSPKLVFKACQWILDNNSGSSE